MARLYPKYKTADETHRVIVVGAGIAGLVAARTLSQAGVQALVLEQEAHIGGRCATLRRGPGVFDFGAQYYTIRNEAFRRIADFWRESGAAREWARVFPDTSGVSEREGHPRYCGVEGMGGLARALASGCEVRTGARVRQITEGRACWLVELEDRRILQADLVILTPPVPVSLRLISDEITWRLGALLLPLSGLEYKPFITVTALLDGPSGLPRPGAVRVDDDQVAWIADNQMKGISPDAPGVTIRGAQRFCDAWKEAPPEEAGALLADKAGAYVRAGILDYQTHVWTYGAPDRTLMGTHYLVDARAPLYFAGDAFAGGQIEGAALSGMAAGQAAAARLKASAHPS